MSGEISTTLTPVDRELRQRALDLLDRHLASGGDDIVLSGEEVRLVTDVGERSARLTMYCQGGPDLPQETKHRTREERTALSEMARWAQEARGIEGIRRQRWRDFVVDRTYDRTAPLVLSSALIAEGVELPPATCLQTLFPSEGPLSDRGTLKWDGQPLRGEQGLADLLDRLGIRHIDIAAHQLPSGRALGDMRDADVVVATLHQPVQLTPAALSERIEALAATLPSLYLIRLPRRSGKVDPSAIPAGWQADPAAADQIRHQLRDANRRRMAPLRQLWPGHRIPPTLRARAANVLTDGEPVLDYLAKVRHQRASAGVLGARDLGMCAHLANIVDGLARDAGFARRCKELASHPLGPCADAGMLTLSAMSALRDASNATSLPEVAENAFVQACYARADSLCAQRSPDNEEVLEEAMVVRWHVSQALAELLGAERVRVADKPLFGSYGAGRGWNSPTRRAEFREEARALIAREITDGFPGVVQLLSARDDPLGILFQAPVDQTPECAVFADRRQAALEGYELAVDGGEDEEIASLRVAGELKQIDEAHNAARLRALAPGLDAIRSRAGSGDAR